MNFTIWASENDSDFGGRKAGGWEDLLDQVISYFGEWKPGGEEDEIPRIAIVGKPNVGKSSIINKIIGAESGDCVRRGGHDPRCH